MLEVTADGTNDKVTLLYLSGTSMSTPVVSGAAALMLQANPKLTPNMVKMILMYTAQPIAGFNHLEQGAGQVNIEGAVRFAKLDPTGSDSRNPARNTDADDDNVPYTAIYDRGRRLSGRKASYSTRGGVGAPS